MSSATRLFTDLAVGKKLLLGFGLVLLLTVTVTATGFFAVNSVSQRHQQVSEFSEVDARILEARRMERDFALSGDAARATQVREALGEVQALLTQRAAAQSGDDRARLQTMAQATGDYLAQFEAFVAQRDKARAARQQMDEAATEAREQFDIVELDMYDAVRELRLQGDKLRGSDPLTLAETASGLSKRMLDLRSNESLYIIDGSDEALENWTLISEEQTSIARNLTIWLDDSQKATIETSLVALKRYQDAFANYQQVRQQNSEIETAQRLTMIGFSRRFTRTWSRDGCCK